MLRYKFLLFVLLLFIAITYGETKEFTLVNDTGMDIYALYISPKDEDNFGEDILGLDVLADGESAEIKVDIKGDTCVWDLMIEDEDGDSYYWDEIDLCKYKRITLQYTKEKATATFE